MSIRSTVWKSTLLIFLSACASNQPPRESEVDQLRQANLELRRDAAMHKVEIARLEKEIEALERQRASSPKSAPAEKVQPATRRTSEAQNARAPEPTATRPPPVEQIELTEPPAARTESTPKKAVSEPLGEQQSYDAAYALFHEKKYQLAAARFQQFVESFPNSALADNAQFWIGECHYARGDYEQALKAFSATVERYPDGNKVADSLLKAGRCLAGLGDLERAQQTYQEVRTRFPGTGAAATAAELLRER